MGLYDDLVPKKETAVAEPPKEGFLKKVGRAILPQPIEDKVLGPKYVPPAAPVVPVSPIRSGSLYQDLVPTEKQPEGKPYQSIYADLIPQKQKEVATPAEEKVGVLGTLQRTAHSAILDIGKTFFTGLRMGSENLSTKPEVMEGTEHIRGKIDAFIEKSPFLKSADASLRKAHAKFKDLIFAPITENSKAAIKVLDEKQLEVIKPILDDKPGLSNLNEYIFTIGGGLISLGESIGLTFITKNPTAAAGFLSFLEASPIYNEARDKGMTPEQALVTSSKSGAGTFILEKIGLDYLFGLHGGSKIVNGLKASGFDTAQEEIQTVWQNLVRKTDLDSATNIFEGLWETAVGTAIPAFVAGLILPGIDTNIRRDLQRKLQTEAGLDRQQAVKTAAAMEQMVHEARQAMETTRPSVGGQEAKDDDVSNQPSIPSPETVASTPAIELQKQFEAQQSAVTGKTPEEALAIASEARAETRGELNEKELAAIPPEIRPAVVNLTREIKNVEAMDPIDQLPDARAVLDSVKAQYEAFRAQLEGKDGASVLQKLDRRIAAIESRLGVGTQAAQPKPEMIGKEVTAKSKTSGKAQTIRVISVKGNDVLAERTDLEVGAGIPMLYKGDKFEFQPAQPKNLESFISDLKVPALDIILKKFDETGSAIIAEKPGMRMVIKDEGDFVKIGVDTGGLSNTDTVLPSKTFSTKEEAFEFLQTIQQRGKSQAEKVKESVQEKPKTIKEVSEETGILEPNVRRILGVGTKKGTFERVDKGVYVLRDAAGKEHAYVEVGDAKEVLARIAREGDRKFESVILDPAYFSRALIGGNRGIKDWSFILPEDFSSVMQSISQLVSSKDSQVYLMLSGAKSAQVDMEKYVKGATDAGFKPVGEGSYTKLTKDGKLVTNVRGVAAAPERILLMTLSGETRKGEIPVELNFKFIRPSIAKSYQTEKPAELMKALILQSTLEGETVLDPFAGSGVTGAEAIKEGRRAVLIEKEEKTVEQFIKPRLEEVKIKATPEQTKEFKELITDLEKNITDIYAPKKEAAVEALNTIMMEMELSEPGRRSFVITEGGYSEGSIREPSTFPKWVPEELRSKDLFNKVIVGFKDGAIHFPEGRRNKQRELYNSILDELDKRLGVSTKDTRSAILEAYERGSETGVAKEIRGRLTRGEGLSNRGKEIEVEGLFDTPSGEASIGNYNDKIPVQAGQLNKINPIEFPELVDLARQLSGSVPIAVGKTGNALGRFYGEGAGKIKLVTELFKKGNEMQLARVLAHEIGHLVDYLPDHTLTRGNMLGHLLTLQKFLKKSFPDLEITNPQLKKELKTLSELWKPLPKGAPKSFLAYRARPKEIYADFISALFGSPGFVEKNAPLAYGLFFETLDNKPEVKRAYFDLQTLLNQGKDAVVANRREGVRNMFKEGDYRSKDLQEKRLRERDARAKDYWYQFKSQFVSRFAGVEEKINQSRKEGKIISDDENPAYYLRESNYIGGKIKSFVDIDIAPTYKELSANAISWDDFGEALFYERIIAGDRSEIANPRGITPEAAKDSYEALKQSLGPEKTGIVQKNAALFRNAIKKIAEEAYQEGLYTDELYKQMQENPAYVSFRVIEHLDKEVTAKVYQQIGTLKDITNPADATILKMIATIRAVERNKTTRVTVEFLEENHPTEIKDANKIFTGKALVPVESRLENEDLLTYYQKGKIKGVYVDPYISVAFQRNTTAGNNLIVRSLKFFNSGLFRPLFITFNTGFQAFNTIRDFTRFWKNTPQLSVFRALKRYSEALRPAKIRAFGLPENPTEADLEAQKVIQSLEHDKVLSVTFNDLIRGQEVEDKQIEQIFRNAKIESLAPEKPVHPLLKPIKAILNFIERTGNLIETLPKVAGYFELKDRMPPMEMRDFIRRRLGSPDFLDKGVATPVTNEIFLFSNSIIQGIRSDIESAVLDPKTRSGYWWKTAARSLAPKLLMFAAALGLLGDDLREMFENISEYDKTNYTTIPFGKDDKGRTAYIRIPEDESGRLISGLFWKTLNIGQHHQSFLADLSDIASYAGGQAPNLSPSISAFGATTQFLAGQNPYDFFRGRNVLTDTQFRAGGWDATKPFLGWMFQQLGGGVFVKFYTNEPVPKESTPLEKVLGLPVVSNVAGRFVKISDYGLTEKLREETKPIEQEAARKTLKEKRLINDYIEKYQKSAKTPADLRRLKNEMVEEMFEGKPKTQDEANDAKRMAQKLQIGIEKGEADPRINALIAAVSNDQKVALIREFKKTLTDEEFNELRKTVLKNKIASAFVFARARQGGK